MSGDTYLTIAAPVEGLYKDKGSRFMAFACPVRCEQEIKPLVDRLRADYYDARHHCYAWRLGVPDTPRERFRVNDDGEPSGSAGRPIYGQIQSRGLTDLLIVVVRYFGGTKLGIPGLIQAYREAAQEALNGAVIVEAVRSEEISMEFGYAAMNGVMKTIKGLGSGVEILGRQSDMVCRMHLRVRLRDAEEAKQRLRDIAGVAIL